MKVRRSRLSVAVGAVLSAAVLAPATALGVTYDVSDSRVESDSGGDALLFPMYTTVNGATTSFSVTNRDDAVAAIKIRFREQEHSMDVLDFIVVMSPEDKFDFWVSQGPNDERPVMGWNDNSCVVGPDGNSVTFPPPNTPFVTTNEQMQVGHLEVLGTRDLSETCYDPDASSASSRFYTSSSCDTGDISVGDAAIHDETGEPANCDLLVDLLSNPEDTYWINQCGSDDLENDLLGRYVITAGADGVEAGGDPLEIENTDLSLYAQSNASCGEPDDNQEDSAGYCTSYYAWDAVAWDHPHLGNMFNLDGLQYTTSAEIVAGDWSNNPANAVGVDWVMTFFAKYAYLDYIAKSECNDSGSAKAWCLLYETPTNEGVDGIWTDESTLNTCLVDNTLSVWDTEEAKATGNVNVSPGQRDTLDLCNEVNVFTLAAEEGAAPRDSLIQTADRRAVIGFKNLDALRGWAELELPCNDNGLVDDRNGGEDLCPSSGGLIFTTRATDNPLYNNGSITEIKKVDTFCGGDAEDCVGRD